MVIGTASLILVVTIGLTGKQYVLQQIQSIGANMITADYEGGSIYSAESANDYMTVDDLNAVRQQVPNITASSPMIELHDQITVPGWPRARCAGAGRCGGVPLGAQSRRAYRTLSGGQRHARRAARSQ